MYPLGPCSHEVPHPTPVLCILLELAQVPRPLRVEGHTHQAQERAELFPLISFPSGRVQALVPCPSPISTWL